ncbi:hypothetical protein HCH_04323 [Hahella chejuensis KCTC 2396]|uniref:Lipoprotein n=1 Tax=Hahella chejuensis (strain KCTC 2396) TaxID=349521 RepID=Q2SE95_HAHCH|nr:hypothetical protein [Hahella chejuensis]ABC31029.1 hypothetical protein HCH_04323 [Hahella chejuensis KCTC 2396]
MKQIVLLILCFSFFGCAGSVNISQQEIRHVNISTSDGIDLPHSLVVIFESDQKKILENAPVLRSDFILYNAQNEKILSGTSLVSYYLGDVKSIVNTQPGSEYKYATVLVKNYMVRGRLSGGQEEQPVDIREQPFSYMTISISAPSVGLPKSLVSNTVRLSKEDILAALERRGEKLSYTP